MSYTEKSNLFEIEKYSFPVIKKVMKTLENTNYQFVSGDSSTVRAYTPFTRDFEDIDLIFKANTNIQEFQKLISKEHPNCIYEELVIVKENTVNGAFLRTRFPIDITYQMENYFIIDFHFGGSIYEGEFKFIANDSFFEGKEWKLIKSVSQLEEVKIPVTKKEKFIHFKLLKFWGGDIADIISLLAFSQIDIFLLKECTKLNEKAILLNNIRIIKENLEKYITNWETLHFCRFDNLKRQKLKQNLISINTMLR